MGLLPTEMLLKEEEENDIHSWDDDYNKGNIFPQWHEHIHIQQQQILARMLHEASFQRHKVLVVVGRPHDVSSGDRKVDSLQTVDFQRKAVIETSFM